MALAPLTEAEVRQFVAEWYHGLDIHLSLEGFLAQVADEGIEFRFPEVTVTDKVGLTQWYQRVTNTFFDEIHETQDLAITIDGDTANVKLTTRWTSSVWNAPAAKSERNVFLAGQTWRVKRSEKTGKPVVVAYIVDTFDPVSGSNALPVKDVATAK